MQKEKDDEKMLKTIRDREHILIETRHNNMMKGNLDKVAHVECLEKWVQRGFSTTRSTRKKVNLQTSPHLEKLSKIAASPAKLKEYTVDIEI